MRFVITGASGHIGNNLIRYINSVDSDANIVALVRRDISRELIGTINVEQVVGDITDINFLNSKILSDDIVVHCAAVIDMTNKRKDLSHDINFLSTKHICDVCEKKKVRKFVYLGSVDAIYKQGDEQIAEPQDYYPDQLKGVYSVTKAEASKYVLDRIKENSKFNAAIILPTAVIGVNDYRPSEIGKVIINTIKGKAEFGIKGGYNFVDVEDVSKCIYNACVTNVRGQYIISGENVTVVKLYQMINECLNINKKPILVPMWLVWLSMPFVKVLNPVTVRTLREPHNYINDRAVKDLEYEPTPIQDTIAKTVNWFLKKM